MSETNKSSAWGFREIIILVVLCGFFAWVAIPSFIRARNASEANTCINHMIQISAAKNQWALDHHAKPGDIVTEDDIKPYVKLDSNGNLPKCPAGGTYTIGVVIPLGVAITNGQYQDVTCSIGTNVIPWHVGAWDFRVHP